jgi:DNA gyrase subunit A
VHRTRRDTMGVRFATPDKGDSIVAVARNAERNGEADDALAGEVDPDADGQVAVPAEHDVATDAETTGADEATPASDAVTSAESEDGTAGGNE